MFKPFNFQYPDTKSASLKYLCPFTYHRMASDRDFVSCPRSLYKRTSSLACKYAEKNVNNIPPNSSRGSGCHWNMYCRMNSLISTWKPHNLVEIDEHSAARCSDGCATYYRRHQVKSNNHSVQRSYRLKNCSEWELPLILLFLSFVYALVPLSDCATTFGPKSDSSGNGHLHSNGCNHAYPKPHEVSNLTW